jgi:hypothetical protein
MNQGVVILVVASLLWTGCLGVVGGAGDGAPGGRPPDTVAGSGGGGPSGSQGGDATGSTTSGAGSGGDTTSAGTSGSGGAGGGATSGGSGGENAVDGATDGSAICNDDRGMPSECAATGGDAGCDSVTAYCRRLASYLKPAVFAQFVSCINGITQCDDAQAARCAKASLFGACPDSSAEPACGDVSRVCASSIPTTVEECHAFLKGMTPEGRQAILSCLSPSDGAPTCPAGIFACIRSL